MLTKVNKGKTFKTWLQTLFGTKALPNDLWKQLSLCFAQTKALAPLP